MNEKQQNGQDRATALRVSPTAHAVLERICKAHGNPPKGHMLERILLWVAHWPSFERCAFRPHPISPERIGILAGWCKLKDRDGDWMLSQLVAFAAEREDEFLEFVTR
jgi:hypothetical protein